MSRGRMVTRQIYLRPEVDERLKLIASDYRVPMNAILREIIGEGLDEWVRKRDGSKAWVSAQPGDE